MKSSKINEIKLIFLIAIALVIFISLLTFDRNDVGFLTSNPNLAKNNIVGFVGAYLAWTLFFLMGFASYVIPFFIALWGIMSLSEERSRKLHLRVFGAFFSILAISSILSLAGSSDTVYRFEKGGIIGLGFSDFLLKYLGTAGTFIVIAVLFLLSFIITTDFLIFPLIGWIIKVLKSAVNGAASLISGKLGRRTPKARPFEKKTFPAAEPRAVKVSPRVAAASKKEEVAVKAEGPRMPFSKPKAPKPVTASVKEPVVYVMPYELPTTDILDSPPPLEEREIRENFEENSRILEETLMDFGVEAKVTKVSKGPVITRYELEPARGVTLNKFTNLSDNIALSMKAVSARVIAPIPGKGTVGIELPNSKSTMVYLKDLLESGEYKKSESLLKLALGKEISGEVLITNLDDMPHLLIAGATGSGKTVCLNSIITALLFNASPDELKFIMVDPKKVELAPFNNLPHLLAPVVKDAKKVSHILNWAAGEMERRFEVFSELGVKNIAAYRQRQKAENLPALPYIVIVIDELHDLMLVARNEVEDLITRLAALARAVGMHMIIATQRPSVDVITGVIKANFPARISFKVASKVDSRTVIDANGADKLLGKGDLLFIEPGNPKPIRAQGSLVNDGEIQRLTDFIKAQRKPDFVEAILKIESKSTRVRFEKDEVYDEAVKVVLNTKQASVSMLQRRLGVGYTRAARLVDMMEDEGIVGPYQGSKPREILVDNVTEDA